MIVEGVRETANEGRLVEDSPRQREFLADERAPQFRLNGRIGPANLSRRSGFGIERLELTRSAPQPDLNHRPVGRRCALLCGVRPQPQDVAEGEPCPAGTEGGGKKSPSRDISRRVVPWHHPCSPTPEIRSTDWIIDGSGATNQRVCN